MCFTLPRFLFNLFAFAIGWQCTTFHAVMTALLSVKITHAHRLAYQQPNDDSILCQSRFHYRTAYT